MPTPPLENDLLDLIEGRLAPDRVEAVRSALSADPALLKQVERLVADRRGIIDLDRATLQAARADHATASELVRDAIEQAEREMLVTPVRLPGRRRLVPLASVAAVVLIAGIIGGGLTWYLIEESNASRIADQKKVERSGHTHMEDAISAKPAEAAAGGGLASDNAVGVDAPSNAAVLPSWLNANPDPTAKETVRAWTAEAEATLAAKADHDHSSAETASSALARIKSGGSKRLSLDEAAALATTHHLRFMVRPAGLDWSRRRAEVMSAVIKSGGRSDLAPEEADASLSRGEMRVEITAELDPERAALHDSLADLQRRFSGPQSQSGWFEIDPEASADPPVLPSLKLNDILWWSNSTTLWRPGISIRVRVQTIENAGE